MRARIIVALFGLPFFAVGAWMLWSIGSTLVSAWQMDDWVQVPAQLTRAGYETHSGDDSDTYEAFATYRYEAGGRRYENDRVSVSGGGDNIGDYQQDLGRNLRRAWTHGDTILVYVDPEQPELSIIDRGVRWGLIGFKSIFVLVFGGVGLGLIIAAWKTPKQKDRALPKFQDAPWLLNEAWQTPGIGSSSRSSMIGAWLFAAIWNLISAPLPFLLYDEVIEKQNYLALVGLLFPIVGAGLLVWATRRTLEWRRFGAAPVTLDPFPGSIGGHVGGTIDLNVPFDPNTAFKLSLTSIRSYISGSGKNRSRREKALWQDNLIAHSEPGTNGTRLSFRFDVPEGLNESDAEKADSYHVWRLNLSAELPGTDLDRDYEIPVYATATRSRSLPDIAMQRSREQQSLADDEAVRKLVNLGATGGTKRLFFPAGRHIASAIGGFVIGAVFTAAGWFLVSHEGHTIFGSIFGGSGALVAIACLYMMLNSLEVVQSGGEIRTTRRLLGLPIGQKRMHREAIARLAKNSSFKTQSGNRHTVYYSIEAIDRQGNKLLIGEGFRGKNEADAAIRLIAREFGVTRAANDPGAAGEGYGAELLRSAD